MKKKGFTLIELLAVIIILAIISLIVTPMISNIIKNATKAAARSSAQGYIDAVKQKAAVAVLDGQALDEINMVSDLDHILKYSGSRVEKGIVIIDGDILEEARICVNGYSFEYFNDKLAESTVNYCIDNSNVEVSILGSEPIQESSSQYRYDLDLTNYDISNATNVVCNNNAIPSIENDTLHVKHVYGDTKCSIGNNLVNTFTNLDDTTNNVVMMADETISTTLTLAEGKNAIFDLNGKDVKITNPNDPDNTLTAESDNYRLNLRGSLEFNDSDGTGSFTCPKTSSLIVIYSTGKLEINGGNYDGRRVVNNVGGYVELNNGNFNSILGENVLNNGATNIVINGGTFTRNDGVGIHNFRNGNITINGGSFYSETATIYNSSSGNVYINGGTFISNSNNAILNSSTNLVTITQTDKPIYITSLAQAWKPAIVNASTGTINITANQANACTSDVADTTSGLCVYAEGDKNYTSSTSNGAVRNSAAGTINVNGGTYYGGNQGFNNHAGGTINIRNIIVSSGKYGMLNNGAGLINICSTTINNAPEELHINSSSTDGVINYSSDVVFRDGASTPTLISSGGTTNAVSTCPITE